MQALGIVIWQRKTDEQIVERIRKIRRMRPWLVGFYVIGILGLMVAGWWVLIGLDTIAVSTDFAGANPVASWGWIVGLIMGSMIGFWVGFAFLCAMELLFAGRKDRILLNCWDALNTGNGGPSQNNLTQSR